MVPDSHNMAVSEPLSLTFTFLGHLQPCGRESSLVSENTGHNYYLSLGTN